MDLAELVRVLKERGNFLSSWCGVETNVESVSELLGSDGKYRLELKLKEQEGV